MSIRNWQSALKRLIVEFEERLTELYFNAAVTPRRLHSLRLVQQLRLPSQCECERSHWSSIVLRRY